MESRSSVNFDIIRVSLNVILSVFQILGAETNLFVPGAHSIASYDYVTTKFQPASKAFIIWSLIFPLCIVYSIYQAIPSQWENSLLRRIGYLTIMSFFSTMLWGILSTTLNPPINISFPAFEWMLAILLSFGVSAPVLLCLRLINITDDTDPITTYQIIFIVVPISLYTGWVTCASFVNISGALQVSGVDNFKITNDLTVGTSIYAIIIGILVSLIIIILRGNITFTCVCIWAYSWIAVRASGRSWKDIETIAFIFIFIFATVALLSQLYHKRHKQNFGSSSRTDMRQSLIPRQNQNPSV
eukprot:gene10129-21126_t